MLVQQFADFLGYNIEPVVLYQVSTESIFFMAYDNYCYTNTLLLTVIVYY